MNTLLLDQALWDLCLDASGNIAMASDPYSIAQDVASAIRLFAGELWYDTTQGVPYFAQILGQQPPVQFMKAQFAKATLTVPGVVSAVCYISAITNRAVSGQVQIKMANGTTASVGFNSNPNGHAALDAFVLDVNTLA